MVRDGENLHVSKYDLVVGDIVQISIGDIIEGDGLLVEGFDVDTDESALTGALDELLGAEQAGER